jgi:hypothetical protein
MQLTATVLQGGWSELIGSLLVATGLAIASWTLGGNGASARAFGVGRPFPARPSQTAARWFNPASQLRRLAGIAEDGFVRIESVADLHARATDAVGAADDAVTRLLRDCRHAFMSPPTGPLPEDQALQREWRRGPERIAA